jgi:AcrR family transcriptional regulator
LTICRPVVIIKISDINYLIISTQGGKMTSARDQIISKTCELFENQGYHATGINQIVKESGAPKGSIYYYFPDGKEEIALEAVIRSGQIMCADPRKTG